MCVVYVERERNICYDMVKKQRYLEICCYPYNDLRLKEARIFLVEVVILDSALLLRSTLFTYFVLTYILSYYM